MRWIIGDIHGMCGPLEALLRAVEREDPDAQLIFAGDYVNRGPDSRQVIDLLLGMASARFIRGNHDDIFDLVLHGSGYSDNAAHGDRLIAFAWFMDHGLDQTLMSYGADYAMLDAVRHRPARARLDAVLDCVPVAHRDFIRDLPSIVEESDFFVIHGMWNPDDLTELPDISDQVAGAKALRERLLWGRFAPEEVGRIKRWGRTGYFGHTPVDNYPTLLGGTELRPIHGDSMVLLDTAVALTRHGRLTAYCHDQRMYIQADRVCQIHTGRAPAAA